MLRALSALIMTGAMLITSPVFAMGQTPPRPRTPLGLQAAHGAGSSGGVHNVHAVPEIDASSGLLAIAAVAAVLLFVWERQRRRAQ